MFMIGPMAFRSAPPPPPPVPEAPHSPYIVNFGFDDYANSNIQFSWQAPNGAVSYEVECNGVGYATTQTQHLFLSPNNQTATARVRARNANGWSRWSETRSVSAPGPTFNFNPVNLDATYDASSDRTIMRIDKATTSTFDWWGGNAGDWGSFTVFSVPFVVQFYYDVRIILGTPSVINPFTSLVPGQQTGYLSVYTQKNIPFYVVVDIHVYRKDTGQFLGTKSVHIRA